MAIDRARGCEEDSIEGTLIPPLVGSCPRDRGRSGALAAVGYHAAFKLPATAKQKLRSSGGVVTLAGW